MTQSHRNHQGIQYSVLCGLLPAWSGASGLTKGRIQAPRSLPTSNGIVKHVTSAQVINALRNVVGAISETCLGISKQKMGTHSIRSGATMVMYLGKCPVYTIMLIGWWSSNAFLGYICKQVMQLVMQFSHNVSKKMLHFKNYQHVKNYNYRIAANDPRVCNNPNNAETRRNIGGDALRHSKLRAFVCVFSSTGRRELPSDAVSTTRRIHPHTIQLG
jgi:hypothetical protein